MMNNLTSYLGSQAFNDMCQKFVEQMTLGHSGVYPSAIAAWNANAPKAYSGLQGANPGDIVYFSPNAGNGNNGHTGIYLGNNQFISATDQGVKKTDINQWMQATGQKLLGYLPQGSNKSAQGLGTVANAQQQVNPLMQRPTVQAQQFDPVASMNNFRSVWNSTHATPLQAYG